MKFMPVILTGQDRQSPEKNRDEQLRHSGKIYMVPLAKWLAEHYVPVSSFRLSFLDSGFCLAQYSATAANIYKYILKHNIQFK